MIYCSFSGCGCVSTEHGCCPDNFTPAQGPGNAGCLCHTYEYGCCPDGKAIARGPGQVTTFSGLELRTLGQKTTFCPKIRFC